MSERGNTIPGILGCLTGVGCGLVLLVGCLSGVLLTNGTSPDSPIDEPPYPTPPSYPPTPTYPTPTYPTPTYPPPTLPPPPTIPPVIPPAPLGTLAPPSDTLPRLVRATVTSVEGSAGITVGASCEFNVERRDQADGSFACNAQIVCGGRLLYGGPEAGYFPCTLYQGPPRHVVGSDLNTTSADNDGAMSLDTHDALEIWDDASGPNGEFRIRAHVDSVE